MRLKEGEKVVSVTVDGRKFKVLFAATGEPLRIVERKQLDHERAWLRYLYDAPYWSSKHHGGNKKPDSIVSRVIEEARRAP